ncbi:MAG: hypothetical protein ABI440_02350 [Casimicrobiaceae bacterium]
MHAELADPRRHSRAVDSELSAHIAARLAAMSTQQAATEDRAIDALLTRALDTPGEMLLRLFDAAPEPAAYRHLWRRLSHVMAAATPVAADPLGVVLFALPLVIVTGCEGTEPVPVRATLFDVQPFAELLRAHDALAGNRNFALSNALVAAGALELSALPGLRQAAAQAIPAGGEPLALSPAAIAAAPGESVHLRFMVGSALCAPGATLLGDAQAGTWAKPMAEALAGALATDGAHVLALPRAPAPLPSALSAGKLAQREVSAQIFVTNALRRMRASVGEPTAILSAHRLDDGDGELRLSLSSPFSPRDAEGFRCPLFAFERVGDAASMLEDLLRDCRVTDVRVQPGVHPDRVPGSAMPLLFKPDALSGDSARSNN